MMIRIGCDYQYEPYHSHRYHTDEEIERYRIHEELWKDPSYRAKIHAENDKMLEEMIERTKHLRL